MERPAWAPQGIDLTVPSVSRMYDYYLGGSHNFEVDREAGRRAVEVWPGLPKLAQANRAFLRRAVRYALDQGIGQFLDIGSGIPTFGNVHEVAREGDPKARVVYVDNDPVAVAHSNAVLKDDDLAVMVSADVRSPQDIVDSPDVRRMLDFDRPVALLLVAVLHFVEDKDDPWARVRELWQALAPDSLVVVSHVSADEGARFDTPGLTDVYSRTSSPLIMRSRAEIARFLDGLDPVPPGVVTLPHWRSDEEPEGDYLYQLSGYAGVGRTVERAG